MKAKRPDKDINTGMERAAMKNSSLFLRADMYFNHLKKSAIPLDLYKRQWYNLLCSVEIPMEEKKNRKREFVEISRLTSVGIGLIISMMIGWFIGNIIDKHFHTAPIFMIVFLLLGISAGIINVFRTLGKNSD
jgi:ATP synthase protein I